MVKQKTVTQQMLVLIVAVLVVGVGVMWGFGVGPFSTTETATTGTGSGTAIVGGTACPDTLSTTLTVTAVNPLNTTGDESYDQTARIYKMSSTGTEALFATVTDTTAGTATLNCGDTYRLRFQSADSANARVDAVRSGEGATVGDDGKYVEFTAGAAVYNLEVETSQRDVLKIKAFDLDANAWVFAADGLGASAYRTLDSAVTFKSVTDNATATAVTASDNIDWRFNIEANGDDVDANDFGIYVLIDASTADWQEPELSFAGADLEDVTGNLDTFEGRAFSNYEYAYKIDSSIVDNDKTLSFSISPVDGVDPSSDIGIDFAGIGASKATSSNIMRYAATTDASSPATVFTLQEATIDVS